MATEFTPQEKHVLREALVSYLQDLAAKKKLWEHADNAKEINKRIEQQRSIACALHKHFTRL